MNKYTKLKEIVKLLLLDNPIDIDCECNIESAEDRIFEGTSTRKIGTNNLLEGFQAIQDVCLPLIKLKQANLQNSNVSEVMISIYEKIIRELQEEKIIRYKPELMRQNLKLIIEKDI